ncbi:MAG: tRNA (N6-threonylcarbamoyladenosine(37)-N6)-methyltransferase TrmO [Planctomycetota bacterium]
MTEEHDDSTPRMPLRAIGTFRGDADFRYTLPSQPGQAGSRPGVIELYPGHNYEQALADLDGFSHVWVIFWFHEATTWRPKVQPPLRQGRRGVFGTRAPHRPNPIGLSCLPLLSVSGRQVRVGAADLLDGTPILDLKPYLPYSDAHPDATSGWVDDEVSAYEIVWSELAWRQCTWLATRDVPVAEWVVSPLSLRPFSRPGHRVEELPATSRTTVPAVFAVRTWRVAFTRNDANQTVTIDRITSGHPPTLLAGDETQWGDEELHREFLRVFGPESSGDNA